jgi:hypothetical protein
MPGRLKKSGSPLAWMPPTTTTAPVLSLASRARRRAVLASQVTAVIPTRSGRKEARVAAKASGATLRSRIATSWPSRLPASISRARGSPRKICLMEVMP